MTITIERQATRRLSWVVAAFALASVSMCMVARPAQAQTTVGLELALVVDVSGSISTAEYNLQRNGYVTAFQSAAVQNAIINGPGSIAVTYIEFSGATEQSQRVGWTLINSAATANAFAAAINGLGPRAFSGQTAPGSAINFTTPRFATNLFDSTRQVIDVSGDGAQNDGANTATARDNALAAGIDTINGLAILGEAGLEAWYNANIKGGTDAFVETAATFDAFALSLQTKLTTEIVPEPASIVLLGLALSGLGVIRHRATAGRRSLRLG